MAMRCLFLLLLTSALLCACGQPAAPLALGTLERDRLLLKATAAEMITEVPVAEGQSVAAGQLLVQLNPARQQAAVAKAQAAVSSAQAVLEKLQNGSRTEDIAAARAQTLKAQAQYKNAQKTLARSQRLFNQSLLSQSELDAARAKHDSAQASVQFAQEQLLLLSHGSRAEDIQNAQAQLAAALAALSIEQIALQDLSIRASRAGRLDSLPKHLGERTSLGETLAILLDSTAPYARVYVPESARVHLHAGQTLPVAVDGLAEKIPGHLRWISQEPAFTPYYALNSADRSRLVYVAEVQLPDSAQNLPSGVPVQVELPHE